MMYMLGLIPFCTCPFLQTYPKMALSPPIGVQISLNGDKNMQAVSGRPRLGSKNVCKPIGDSIRFFGKNENQSISVINNFLFRSFKKNLNGKKLDFYILKVLD